MAKVQYGKRVSSVPPARPESNTQTHIRGLQINTVPPPPPTPKTK